MTRKNQIIIGVLTFLFGIFIFTNFFSSSSTYYGTKNIVGDWHYQKSQIMGDYRITADHKLTIIRNEAGDYSYKLKTTVRDEMYGGYPNTEYSSGNLKTDVIDEQWSFSGGDYGERGAYIVLNDNYYSEEYNPEYLMVKFAPNRGHDIKYER